MASNSPKYRIYIDEVGNPDLESSENPNHRFLSLTGVIVQLDFVQRILHPEMEELKRFFFHQHPDEPIIFHRKELLSAKGPFSCLSDPETRENFDTKLLSLLSNWEFAVISVCLDKKHHKDTYTTWRYDSYHYCLAMILERYALFLKRKDSFGDAMAESRGGKEDSRLKDSYHRLWYQGTMHVEGSLFQERFTSCQLKVKPKANNVSGLQLADLIAHPSRNEILIENGQMVEGRETFGKKICEILASKYDQLDGRIFGKKYI